MSEHIILTGPQRTGKAFMLEVLTRIGMDTGFTVEDFKNPENEFFELNFWGEHYHRNPPNVIKHARLASCLEERAKLLGWEIDGVLIFIRNVDDAVSSGMRLGRGDTPHSLKRRFYNRLGKILYQCHRNNWDYSVVEYEKMVRDWKYTLTQIRGSIPYQLPDKEFKAAWKETKKRRKV